MLEVTGAGIVAIGGLISAGVGIVFIRYYGGREEEGRLARWYWYLFFSSMAWVNLGIVLGLFRAVMALSTDTFGILAALGIVIGLAIGSILFRLNEDQSVIGIIESRITQY